MKPQKIAPGLLNALLDVKERQTPALAVRARSLAVAHVVGSQKEPSIPVFLRVKEQADFASLAKYGVRVNETTGVVRTAYLPVSAIEHLSNHSAVRRISPSRRLRPHLDVAVPAVHVPQFRTKSGTTGIGTIVGIVDSGIDPNHPSFAGRILRIWDQTLAGPGVTEGGFGLELTGAAMTASRDTDGHGTHVAGIASGVHAVFGGVAPSANIIFVKTDFSDSHIGSGIRYIFRVARELNRPAVVNLSLGGHFDAHDGTDELSALIDQESGPGRIVVCAAGNEGEDNIHATGKIKKNVTTRIRVAVPHSNVPIVLNGWYSGKDRFDISIDPPTGPGTGFRNVITTGNPAKSFNLSAGRVLVATPGPDPVNGDVHFQIEIHPPRGGSLLRSGAWKLNVRGVTVTNGRLDVWATDFEAGSSAVFLDNMANDMKIGSPGSSLRAVTVAAFTTRDEWVDRQGDTVAVEFSKGDLAPFSSPGPLRNKVKKPDVAAPGAMIISALSADSSPDDEQSLVTDTKEVVEAGTSMASPFIAGIVALLLQSTPTMTPETVKQRLKSASRIPQRAAGTFANGWGFGLIDGNRL